MREIIAAAIEKHEGEIGGVRIAVRNGTKFRTVARIYVREREPKLRDDDPDGALKPAWVDTESELEDAIVEELDELAHDDTADGWRVYFYDPICDQIASKQRSFDPAEREETEPPPTGGDATAILGTALRDGMREMRMMMRESTRALGVLATTLGARESVTGKALEDMVNARIGEIKAEAEAFESVLAAEAALNETIQDDGEQSSVQAGALGLIEQFLSRIGIGGGGAAAVPDLDAMADAFVDDPELQARAADAMRRAAERKAARDAATNSAAEDAPAGAS